MAKTRKSQTPQEYEAQKAEFRQTGPLLNTDDWLYHAQLDQLHPSKLRVMMLHSCEKAYYDRDYDKCMEMIRKAEKAFGVDESVDYEEQYGQRTKKEKKAMMSEKHIMELKYIKERCEAGAIVKAKADL